MIYLQFLLNKLIIISILILPLLSTLSEAKNIIDLITYKDENGRLRRRFADPNNIPYPINEPRNFPDNIKELIPSNGRYDTNKRDVMKLPLEIDDLFIDEHNFKEVDQFVFSSLGDYKITPVSLDSTLPLVKEIELFASYSRNDVELSDLFNDANQDIIIIAPTNNAISQLSLKPWQFPIDIKHLEEKHSSEQEVDVAIQDNIVRFVRSHVVSYNDNETSYKKLKPGLTLLRSLANNEVSNEGDILLKKDEDGLYYIASIKDEKFHLVERIENSSNGVILVIDSCLVWP